uniref:D-aspartate oxidase n=1 Tax=Macaca fascicularis TaxID=9541 RepID=A0A7N9IAI5_MACFA
MEGSRARKGRAWQRQHHGDDRLRSLAPFSRAMDDRDSCAGQWKGRPGECPESSHQWEAVSLSLCLRARDQPGTAKQVLVPETLVASKTAFSETDTPIHTQKQWFRETFNHLFAIANSAEAGDAGVHLVSGWQIFQSTPTEELPFWADVVLGFRRMTEAELKKFPQYVFGQAFTTLKCECPAYLPWLEKRIKGSEGWMLTRRIDDLWELYPSFDIVVNCSGLGSRQLAGDAKIFPVRGQVLQVQAPWVEHFIRDGSGLTYIYPGTSHVTLGGTRQKGDWNLSPDAENSREILSRCCALEPSLHGACDIREKVGLRPYRPGVRLQTELLARDGRRLPVVHHYGHGSGGISVHWGTALEAARLVSECVHALRTPIPKSKL